MPPASSTTASPTARRQVFAIFSLPNSTDLYATVIGAMDGSQEQYFCDVLFYYDDPHTIYDNWPQNVWAAIDAHQVLARHERASNPNVHRPESSKVEVPAKATAP